MEVCFPVVSFLSTVGSQLPAQGSGRALYLLRHALNLNLNPVVRDTRVFGAFSLLQSDSALEIPSSRSSKARRVDLSGYGNLVIVTGS